MLELTDMQVIRALTKRHDFSFSKGLGQNFLIDPEVCPAIAEYGIPRPECGVLEIGTGFGVLTQQLGAGCRRRAGPPPETRPRRNACGIQKYPHRLAGYHEGRSARIRTGAVRGT